MPKGLPSRPNLHRTSGELTSKASVRQKVNEAHFDCFGTGFVLILGFLEKCFCLILVSTYGVGLFALDEELNFLILTALPSNFPSHSKCPG